MEPNYYHKQLDTSLRQDLVLIVYNADFMKDVPLLEERNGQILKLLIGGTQVQILCREDNWIQVTDGKDIGWITEDYMKIIPEKLLEVE